MLSLTLLLKQFRLSKAAKNLFVASIRNILVELIFFTPPLLREKNLLSSVFLNYPETNILQHVTALARTGIDNVNFAPGYMYIIHIPIPVLEL